MANSDRLPWFPCYPEKWLGALAGMSPVTGYVYVVVCLRIYEIGGPCPDGVETIARRTHHNKRQVSDALDALFRDGKLVRQEGGIMSPFAETILSDMTSHRQKLSEAGRAGALKRHGKTQEKQDTLFSEATARPKRGSSKEHKQLQEEKKKEEDSPPLALTGEPAVELPKDDWPDDYEEIFWSTYPPGRKTDRKKVMAKLATIRKNGNRKGKPVAFGTIVEALMRYGRVAEPQYTKAPIVWLNGDCWDDEYALGPKPPNGDGPSGGGQRKVTFYDVEMGNYPGANR